MSTHATTPETQHERERSRTADPGAPRKFGGLSNLTKADLMTVVDEHKATMERQERMIEALLAQVANQQTPNSNSAKRYKMPEPEKYCGGAIELDDFIALLRSNFESHGDLFPNGGPDKVKYALSFLGTWAQHPNTQMHKTEMIDPSTWGRNLRTANHACLHDFDAFAKEMLKTFGDPDRELKAAGKTFETYQQGEDESVRAYGHRIRSNWRAAGWDEDANKQVLYDLTWHGLRPGLRGKFQHLSGTKDRRFKSIDELLDTAASADTARPNRNRQRTDQNRPDDRTSKPNEDKGKKRPYRPSISTGSAVPSSIPPAIPNQSTVIPQNRPTKPRAQWIEPAEFSKRINSGQCTRCAKPGHESRECPTYAPPIRPDQLNTGSMVKRQRSFDNRQQTQHQPAKN